MSIIGRDIQSTAAILFVCHGSYNFGCEIILRLAVSLYTSLASVEEPRAGLLFFAALAKVAEKRDGHELWIPILAGYTYYFGPCRQVSRHSHELPCTNLNIATCALCTANTSRLFQPLSLSPGYSPRLLQQRRCPLAHADA